VTIARLEFREAAVADLMQIHDYLREEASLQLADRFFMAVERTTQQIRSYPNAGNPVRARRSTISSVRWWSVADFPRYLIYYAVGADFADIVRVLHSARDAKRELRDA
jgi:toxin ParE1/3/4